MRHASIIGGAGKVSIPLEETKDALRVFKHFIDNDLLTFTAAMDVQKAWWNVSATIATRNPGSPFRRADVWMAYMQELKKKFMARSRCVRCPPCRVLVASHRIRSRHVGYFHLSEPQSLGCVFFCWDLCAQSTYTLVTTKFTGAETFVRSDGTIEKGAMLTYLQNTDPSLTALPSQWEIFALGYAIKDWRERVNPAAGAGAFHAVTSECCGQFPI